MNGIQEVEGSTPFGSTNPSILLSPLSWLPFPSLKPYAPLATLLAGIESQVEGFTPEGRSVLYGGVVGPGNRGVSPVR